MCEFQESNINGFGDMWWTDKCTYFSSRPYTLYCLVCHVEPMYGTSQLLTLKALPHHWVALNTAVKNVDVRQPNLLDIIF